MMKNKVRRGMWVTNGRGEIGKIENVSGDKEVCDVLWNTRGLSSALTKNLKVMK